MSSQLTNLVPILDGTNYQQWAPSMQSYLMSQGQWKCTKAGTIPPTIIETRGEDNTLISRLGENELADWNENVEKALGNIRLRLHHTISYQFNEEESPSGLWSTLKEKYGTPGLTRAFIEFKAVMDTAIPNNSDPSPAIDKILSHFIRLKDMKFEIPTKVQVMMLLAKAPSSMEPIIQMMVQMAKDSTDDKGPEIEKIVMTMRDSWETHGRSGTGRGNNNNQRQANKLSAVKPANTEPPIFQQQ